jgi:hypothetical protein
MKKNNKLDTHIHCLHSLYFKDRQHLWSLDFCFRSEIENLWRLKFIWIYASWYTWVLRSYFNNVKLYIFKVYLSLHKCINLSLLDHLLTMSNSTLSWFALNFRALETSETNSFAELIWKDQLDTHIHFCF